MAKVLRLILGDQLNRNHSWFQNPDPEILYTLMEIRQETDYTQHHIQKIIGFFLAMRAFAEELRSQGHKVEYLRLDDPRNLQAIPENLNRQVTEYGIQTIEYQIPDEYRLEVQLRDFATQSSIPVVAIDSEHFLTDRAFLGNLFRGKKTFLMETFYRYMRKSLNLLMENGQPLGGRWNYDAENRNAIPKTAVLPEPHVYRHDAGEVMEMLASQGVKTFGRIPSEGFVYPINRKESLELLHYFCTHLLPDFGRYEDAMDTRYPYGYHSRLSFALNTKMLHPLEVAQAAIRESEARPAEIDLAQVEGFVRQIIGWREYMRGIYWEKMPQFGQLNFFNHQASLPTWFWTGKTKMNCLRHCIDQSLNMAYAHHIQRLMVIGNFALLIGVHPDEVDNWYLGVYIDAIEWVEITNTRGMSQFADGGIIGSKPYTASANYISKMSNYCDGCHYNKSLKTGARSCPFNSLYWDFYHRHADKLSRNPRIGMVYRTWAKMDEENKTQILGRAAWIKENADNL